MERKHIVALLLLLCLVVRLAYIILAGDEIFPPDGLLYDELARNVLEGKGFTYQGFKAFRAPGYPLFLALLYVFSSSLFFVRVAGVLMSTFTAYLVYLTAKEAFHNERVSQLSLLFFSLYPYSIYYTAAVSTETLYSLLFMALMYQLLRMSDTREYMLAGVIAAVAILVKPYTLAFMVPAWLWTLMSKKKPLKCIAFSAVAMILILSPWIVRNYLIFDKLVFISTNGGVNLWMGNSPSSEEAVVGEYLHEHRRGIANMSEPELDSYYRAKAISFIRENPRFTLERCVSKLFRTWRVYPEGSMTEKLVSLLTFGLSMPFAAYAALSSRKEWKHVLLFVIAFATIPLSGVLFVPLVRYRNPIDPLVLILAAQGLWLLLAEINLVQKE
ncbi:MAG: glycosyltransferase family 39 protein [Candidatus Altiarchaeota archaeon]